MTIYFVDGFDKYGTDKNNIEKMWDTTSLSNVNSSMSFGRFAPENMNNPSNSLSIYGVDFLEKNISPASEVKIGAAIKFNSIQSSGTGSFITFKYYTDNVTGISVDSDGSLILTKYDTYYSTSSVLQQTNPNQIVANEWYYFEVYLKTKELITTGGFNYYNQAFELRLDGRNIAEFYDEYVVETSETQSINDNLELDYVSLTGVVFSGLYNGNTSIDNITYDDLYIKIRNTYEFDGQLITASINDYLNFGRISTLLPNSIYTASIIFDQTGSTNNSNIITAINSQEPNLNNYIYLKEPQSSIQPLYDLSGTINLSANIKGFSNNILVKNTISNQGLKFWLINYNSNIGEISSSATRTITTDYLYNYKVYDNKIPEQNFPANLSRNDFCNNYGFGLSSGSKTPDF